MADKLVATSPASAATGLLVRIGCAPYAGSRARAALDLALATAAMDQAVTLLFHGCGVLQLCSDQDGTAIRRKTIARTLESLALYDIDQVYAEAAALAHYGLADANLAIPVGRLNADAVRSLLAQHRHSLSY